jgi:hypothetical protein
MRISGSLARPAGRRMIAAAALVVAAAIIAVALWHRSPARPRLVWSKDAGAFGISMPYAGNDRPWSFGAVALCTDNPGRVTIDQLVPLGSDGLRIVAVATRPHLGQAAGVQDNSFGDSQRDLVTEGFSPAQPAKVAATCPADPTASYPGRVIYDELGVQVQRTGSGPGVWTAVRLDYTVGGRHQQLTIPWSLRLCGPEGKTAETCPAAPTPHA